MTTYSHTYFSIPESEGKMLDDIESILHKYNIDSSLSHAVKLSVSEGFTNAMIHGNFRTPHKKIVVEVEINKESIRVDILDEGQKGIEKIKNRQSPSLLSEEGRGINLIQYYVPKVFFEEMDSGGLKVTMIFDRNIEKKENILK
jgi:anti-sigma regulatory factor (Ser/Thr protein kinase)